MTKFTRLQIRVSADQLRRLRKLADRTGLDRTGHIRLAISRYLEEEDLRLAALKKSFGQKPGGA